MVRRLDSFQALLISDEPTPHELLRRIRPDVLVKGGTYTPDEVVGREVVRSYGGRVCVAGAQPGVSTTKILAAIGRPDLSADCRESEKSSCGK